jgi:hypothetical protein
MSAATNVTSGSCHFLKIPLELRLMILRRALPYRATKCVPIDNKKGKACESPDEHWVPGSVAILRVSKQVYSEALQELYSNNYFTIIIQPRRVLLEFLPANRKAQPKFGLIKSNDGVDFRTHAGLPMIRYWYLTFSHHSLGGAGKTKLKVAGFQAFMKWLPQKPLALCWGDLRLAGGGTIYRQMVCVLSAVLHHMFIDWQDRAPAFTDEWIKARYDDNISSNEDLC